MFRFLIWACISLSMLRLATCSAHLVGCTALEQELTDHDISELGHEFSDMADLLIPEYFQSVVRESETHRSSIGLRRSGDSTEAEEIVHRIMVRLWRCALVSSLRNCDPNTKHISPVKASVGQVGCLRSRLNDRDRTRGSAQHESLSTSASYWQANPSDHSENEEVYEISVIRELSKISIIIVISGQRRETLEICPYSP
jgi:hypothetical protein